MEINPLAMLLAAFGIQSVQRPLVFTSMLICGVAFLVLGGALLYVVVSELPQKQEIEWVPVLGILGLTGFLFFLSWVSFHFMRKAIKSGDPAGRVQ